MGPSGKVYALAPAKSPSAPPDAPDRSAAVKAIAADPHYTNIVVIAEPAAELLKVKIPEPVDLIWTSQNYHDVHNVKDVDVAAFDKAVFNALKPGGYFIVLDHAAAPGSGANDTSTLHRIDEATVKQEVEAAGFKLVGESKVLRNPSDPHTAKVFDPSVQGHTDQFILKFQARSKTTHGEGVLLAAETARERLAEQAPVGLAGRRVANSVIDEWNFRWSG